MRGKFKAEGFREKTKTEIDEMSPIIDVILFAFDLNSDAILLSYPRYPGHTERLHWHHWKVMNASLPVKRSYYYADRPRTAILLS